MGKWQLQALRLVRVTLFILPLGATDTFLRDAAITERGGEDDELLYEGSSDRGLSSDKWRPNTCTSDAIV